MLTINISKEGETDRVMMHSPVQHDFPWFHFQHLVAGWSRWGRAVRTLLHLALTFDEMRVLYSGRLVGTYEIIVSGRSILVIRLGPPQFLSSDSRFDVNLRLDLVLSYCWNPSPISPNIANRLERIFTRVPTYRETICLTHDPHPLYLIYIHCIPGILIIFKNILIEFQWWHPSLPSPIIVATLMHVGILFVCVGRIGKLATRWFSSASLFNVILEKAFSCGGDVWRIFGWGRRGAIRSNEMDQFIINVTALYLLPHR